MSRKLVKSRLPGLFVLVRKINDSNQIRSQLPRNYAHKEEFS
jgi:hypothetical protein